MFTLKNVSGNELELRHLRTGGVFVKANEYVDINEKLHDETSEAYVTVRTEPNIKGKDDNGALIWEDEQVYEAWPKSQWEKVAREKKASSEKEEK